LNTAHSMSAGIRGINTDGDVTMQYEEILQRLKELGNPEAVKGMARFGINPEHTYGVSIPNLRKMAKETGKNHALALQLWESGIHEARILAGMIENPKQCTPEQANHWVSGFDSWDVCDQCCLNLLVKVPFAYEKAIEWSTNDGEFIKRAGFALMACIAFKDKQADNIVFEPFFPAILKESTDNRNYVKKAVNWALRQTGKRNLTLNKRAIEVAEKISEIDSKSARWIASDALRELRSEAVQKRLR